LLTVTVVALNRRAGLQAKIAANQVRTVQTQFGQLAAFEYAAWKLRNDPVWRTDPLGENYEFDDVAYNLKILNSNLTCPPGVIMVSITAPGASRPVTAGLRIRYVHQDTVYIADTENDKIKMVDPTNERLYTVPTPDLDKPKGLAVDASGNIYIADTNNDRIIKVDISEYTSPGQFTVTSEILETGLLKPRGLFVQNGSITRLYIADTENYRIKQVDSTGAVSILGAGTLQKPRGVAADCPGNVYIADTENLRIRQVAASTGAVSTFNTGALEVNKPGDVAADEQGNIYVADTENHRVIKVDTLGAVTTIGGSLTKPRGVAVGASGNVYIADTDNHCVRKVDTAGVVSIFAGKCGNGGETGDGTLAIHTKLDKPHAVAVFSQATSNVRALEWIAESS
jgi:streptogramin lyase